MVPLKTRRKLKELGSIGLSRNKIARFADISPSALSRFLSGERSGLNIAAKVLSFITGTEKLSEFKVNGTSGEIIAIKEHSTKGKTKLYITMPPDERILYETVVFETDEVLKSCKNIREIIDKLKELSSKLSEKYQNKIQIPYWIGFHLFKVYLLLNGADTAQEHTNIPICCSTSQQKSIILGGVREILSSLLMKIDLEVVSRKEIEYKMRALNQEGLVLAYQEKPEEASKSFLKGMQVGINWLGSQKDISEPANYIVWERLLELALNNLNNALYSYDSKLIADSKDLFLLIDKDFCRPKSIVGEAVLNKIIEVMKEHRDNDLPSDPESAPFSCFFKNYAGFKRYFVETSKTKKEVVLV